MPPHVLLQAIRELIEATHRTTDARTHLEAMTKFISFVAL